MIAKPVSLERLKVLIDDGLGIRQTAPEKRYQDILVGQSPAMDTLREQVGKLARSQAPIYIRGESGSGKELAALRKRFERALRAHARSSATMRR